jgi:TRAP-type mannitol/chloroaromatic compound transport system substrate-binding protein
VAIDPLEVTTSTVDWVIGTVVVVVPPLLVRTWEMVSDWAIETDSVPPLAVSMATEVTGVTDGELTKADPDNEETVTPDSVTTGELQAGAGE